MLSQPNFLNFQNFSPNTPGIHLGRRRPPGRTRPPSRRAAHKILDPLRTPPAWRQPESRARRAAHPRMGETRGGCGAYVLYRTAPARHRALSFPAKFSKKLRELMTLPPFAPHGGDLLRLCPFAQARRASIRMGGLVPQIRPAFAPSCQWLGFSSRTACRAKRATDDADGEQRDDPELDRWME